MICLFFLFSFFLYSTNYFLDMTHPFSNIHHLTMAITHHDNRDDGKWEGWQGNAQETLYNVSWACGIYFFCTRFFFFIVLTTFLDMAYLFSNIHCMFWWWRGMMRGKRWAMSKTLRPRHPWKGPNDKTVVWALCNVFIFIFCLLLLTAYF